MAGVLMNSSGAAAIRADRRSARPAPETAEVSTTWTRCPRRRLHEFRRRGVPVGLVEGDDQRDLPAGKFGQDFLLKRTPARRLRHQNGQVGSVEDLPGPRHALRPEGAHVVDAGRVDELDRAQRQQFHRLLHRVGGGPGPVRHDGHFLPGEGVKQGRLADVPAAEQADVQAHAAGRPPAFGDGGLFLIHGDIIPESCALAKWVCLTESRSPALKQPVRAAGPGLDRISDNWTI